MRTIVASHTNLLDLFVFYSVIPAISSTGSHYASLLSVSRETFALALYLLDVLLAGGLLLCFT